MFSGVEVLSLAIDPHFGVGVAKPLFCLSPEP